MKALDIQALPDDPKALKSLLTDFTQQLVSKDRELTNERNKTLLLEEKIRLLLHQRFGASSEHYRHSGQQELFNEADAEVEADKHQADDEGLMSVSSHTRRKPGRKPLPQDLPRVDVEHDLPEEDKVCACGHALHRVGEDITEQLDIIPEEIYVIRNIRHKYACRSCDESGITSPALPTQIIPGSIVSPGLLAYVAAAKYVDGLPLYRMEKIFHRLGVELSRRTLANWMIQLSELLAPLLGLLKEQLHQSHVIQMDETRVRVLDDASRQAYMWVSISGGSDPPVVCYQYEASRSGDIPVKLLKGYSGVLVADGYSGYHAVSQSGGIVSAGCMAHVRRKFDEALKAQGTQKTGRAQFALNKIRKLYAIERRIKDRSAEEKRQVREAEARPIMAELRVWLNKSIDQVTPKSALGKALNYMHREWDRLLPWLQDGHIPIDNNRCENAIRPFVVGRKAWLFSKSIKGAAASASIYSVIESAKANNLEPYHYLRHVLTEIASGNQNYPSLLPYNTDPNRLGIQRVG
jgi:transposase